ncbi:MAG: hypothetical protein AAF938_16665 [Myxococcota bacterium]
MSGAEETIERALERFRERFDELVIFDSDRAIADELANEARPAIESLVMALSIGRADDVESLSHHEGVAMVTLLGRRAAILGVTPSGADRVMRALRRAFDDVELSVPESAIDALSLGSLEGFVRGYEERLRDAVETEVESQLVARALVPGVLYLPLHGPIGAEALGRAGESLGRAMHRADASAAIVDLNGLHPKERRIVAAVASADEGARMLGASLHFAGVNGEWANAFKALEPHVLRLHETLQAAFESALEDSGLVVKRPLRLRLRSR